MYWGPHHEGRTTRALLSKDISQGHIISWVRQFGTRQDSDRTWVLTNKYWNKWDEIDLSKLTTIRATRTTFTQNAPSWQIVSIIKKILIFLAMAMMISYQLNSFQGKMWALKMLAVLKALHRATMRKTTTNNSLFLFSCGGARHLHTFATRATWTWLRRLFLGAQGSCNLQLPQFWLNILIHPTLTHPPPFPRHHAFTTSS